MYKSSFILILLIIGCKTQEKATIPAASQVEYNFDFKLQPNKTYIIHSLNDNNSSSELIGDNTEVITPQMAIMFEGDNHIKMGEQTRLITGNLENGVFPLTITYDSIISEFDSPIMTEALANTGDLIQESINKALNTTTFGHSTDQKTIEIDSSSSPNFKEDNNKISNKFAIKLPDNVTSKASITSWTAQEKFPSGLMAIGDTFTHTKKPYVPKPSKRDSIKKVTKNLSPEDQKRKDELDQMREGLKNVKELYQDFYILDRVEENIAYFKIIHAQSSSMSNMLSQEGTGTGVLEYDLKEQYYRKMETLTNTEMRTTMDKIITVTKASYLKRISIELIK